MLLVHIDNHGRFNKKTGPVLLAATGNGGAAFAAHFNVMRDTFLLAGGNQRAHVYAGIQAVAQLHGVGNVGNIGHHIVEMLALNIQPRTGAADLALVEEDGTGRPGSGAFQVGVGHDDGRGLAAQFQGHAGHGVHGDLADLLAHGGGASEGQFVHQRVVGQRRACGDPGAGHHVKHAFGVTGFLHQFGQFKRAQRGFIGRLQHHGAAGCQRRAEFPAG